MEAIMANRIHRIQLVRLNSSWNALQEAFLMKWNLPAKVAFTQTRTILEEMGYDLSQVEDLPKLVESLLRS
jgi:hypothetical protein